MPTPLEVRGQLLTLTGEAVDTANDMLNRFSGPPEQVRWLLLEGIPPVIGYYAEGSAALAADFYDNRRHAAGVTSPYASEMVVSDRTVKIRRAVAWASAPLFVDDILTAADRLAEVVQPEVARPFRDTTLTNSHRDPASVGWRRITAPGGCKLCTMLADRGAVYRKDTARFAAHPNCNCSAEPVFGPNDTGETASAMQYVASQRRRSPEQRQQLRDFLNAHYEDFPG